MGLKAMYTIEVKTRLIEIRRELDELKGRLAKTMPANQTFFAPQVKALEEQYTQLQADHDLLRMFDESEWGKFPDAMDRAIHQLRHDIGALRAAIITPLVPA
ncbi:MAG: hypothetical protein DYG89_25335 [Caldilinea sp. CFX5]|nr:hypothetical protein [Caldilinea sp. CFX5]